MWGVVKALPDAIKSWRDNGDQLYQLTSGAIAGFALVSVVSQSRPSEHLASLMGFLGLGPVAHWLEDDAPPFLAVKNSQVQDIALMGVLVLVTLMVVVPTWQGRLDEGNAVPYQPAGLVGSRSAATVWLLLLVAAQQGPVNDVLLSWYTSFESVVLVLAFLAAGLTVFYFVAARSPGGGIATELLGQLGGLGYRLLIGSFFAVIAIFVCALSLPLGLVGWFTAFQSDRRNEAQMAAESWSRNSLDAPTGAAATIRQSWIRQKR